MVQKSSTHLDSELCDKVTIGHISDRFYASSHSRRMYAPWLGGSASGVDVVIHTITS